MGIVVHCLALRRALSLVECFAVVLLKFLILWKKGPAFSFCIGPWKLGSHPGQWEEGWWEPRLTNVPLLITPSTSQSIFAFFSPPYLMHPDYAKVQSLAHCSLQILALTMTLFL